MSEDLVYLTEDTGLTQSLWLKGLMTGVSARTTVVNWSASSVYKTFSDSAPLDNPLLERQGRLVCVLINTQLKLASDS